MKKMRTFFSFMLIFSIVTLSFSQFTKDNNLAQAANYIYISDKAYSLENGHYKTLRIRGTSRRASWYSSNPKVATVSSGGRVTARASGSTTITAYVAGKRLTSRISVYQISKKDFALSTGQSRSLIVWGPVRNLTWKSSDTSVATVSSSGKVTAKGLGTATITANADGKKLTSKVTVLGIDHKDIVLELGGWSGFIKTLKVTGTDSRINWSSSNKNIATVGSDGRVRAQGYGTATITASVDGAKLTTKVKVLKASDKEFTLEMDETKKLKVYGTSNKVSWHSNQKSVATVSSDGTVTPKGEGDAIITGTVDGRKVRFTVNVED